MQAEAFLQPFDHEHMAFRAGEPSSQAVAVLAGSAYSYFRYEMHLAAMQALDIYDRAAAEFEVFFGRAYPSVETYHAEDAEMVFVMIGSFATKAKAAIDILRASGVKAGLFRPRLLRPFPAAHFRAMPEGVRGVAVIDQNISMGKGGILFTELASVLYGKPLAPLMVSFIAGLGGRDIQEEEFFEIAKITLDAVRTGEVPEPRMLFSADELRQIRKMQAIARVERSNHGGGHER
jgi:pyruvate ferredoxin oxidoreductase alpha subunit